MQTKAKVTVVQQTEERLKTYLFSGKVQPGDRLPSEKDLCAAMGVGRGSLREALRLLAATGYVTLETNRGAFVLRTEELSEEDNVGAWFSNHEVEMNDYLEVRAVCEPLAAKLAIIRCSDEDIQRLHQIHERFEQAVQENNRQEITVQEGNFHDEIIQLSGNELLINIFKLLRKQVIDFRYRSLWLPNAPQNAVTPHARILRAFDLRDPEFGESCMRDHVSLAANHMKTTLTERQST